MAIRVIISLLVLCSISGCSVFMAASSSEEPDLSVLRSGTSRVSIEQALGPAVTTERLMNGDIATYEYLTGDQASYPRAAAYLVADLFTFGMSELFTFRVEALQGDKHTVRVVYDIDERLRAAEIMRESAPMAAPKL